MKSLYLKIRSLSAFLIIVFIFSATSFSEVSASPSWGIFDNGILTMRSAQNEAFLTVNNDQNADPAFFWSEMSSTLQQFRFSYNSQTGYYKMYAKISSDGSNRVLETAYAQNNSNIQIYQAIYPSTQEWIITQAGNGSYYIKLASNQNLVITSDSGEINLRTYTGTIDQKWYIEPTYFQALQGIYYIKNINSGKYLDVYYALQDAGTNVQQWTLNRSIAQQWQIEYINNGYYKIKSVLKTTSNANLVLDVAGAYNTNGANIETWYDWNNSAQKFRLIDNGDYTWHIRPMLSASRSVEVYNDGTFDGANVDIWDYWGGNNQKWVLESVPDRDYYFKPTNGVGNKNTGNDYEYGVHNGVDIKDVGNTTALYSISDGYAIFRYSYWYNNQVQEYQTNSWGNYVEVQTNGSGMARYAHLSSFANGYYGSPYEPDFDGSYESVVITTGSKNVTRGEFLGYTGDTGFADGYHLHFEFMVNYDFEDPECHVDTPGSATTCSHGTNNHITYR